MGIAIALVVLIFPVLFVVGLVLGIVFAARAAKRNGKNPWLWGTVAGLAIYLPLFWDHIPTLITHEYLCSTEAGFHVYKTVEQWKAEYPGVAETLTPTKIAAGGSIFTLPNGTRRMQLNERFALDYEVLPLPLLSTRTSENRFIDVITGELLAKRSSVISGYGDIRAAKYWLNLRPCIRDGKEFGAFSRELQQMGSM